MDVEVGTVDIHKLVLPGAPVLVVVLIIALAVYIVSTVYRSLARVVPKQPLLNIR
jgi:hypothetical protein